MKKVLNIVIFLVVIAAIVFVLKRNKNVNQAKTEMASVVSTAVPVLIDVVREESYKISFSSNGILQPNKVLTLVSDVSGRIESIKIKKGDRVTKGQVLIQVDDEMLIADYTANEASYKAMQTDYERFKNANESGGVTNQQLDNIKTQLVAAKSRYIVSKRRFADASITSPMTGLINERYVEVGSSLNPGARLFDIVDDSKLKMGSSVSAQQVLRLKIGQEVAVKCDVLPGVDLSAKITFIGAIADRGLNFPIELVMNNKDELKAGMYVNAYYESEKESRGLLIPRNAVSGSVKSASVFVVNMGLASKRDVVVGDMLGKKVEIISGLQSGDSILVAGLINVSEGVKVTNKK